MSQSSATSYYLSRIEVFNWGGFNHFHQAIIDEQGTAIIGQTGSGKTTLIDALMTLLVARPRYNLASTGGHESDRDLMSYIRGLAGSGEGLEKVARGGQTVTAISAYFTPVAGTEDNVLTTQNEAQQDLFDAKNDQNQQSITDSSLTASSTIIHPKATAQSTVSLQNDIAIGVIFWLDSTSNSPKDRKDIWLFSDRHGSQLKDWLAKFEAGGSRGLKSWVRGENNLHFYDSKSAYLAKIKSFFAVSEQAFELLNRAVGLKQLNSIDEIFRGLVLEDNSGFTRAEEVITQFNDLTQIKNTLEVAKQQQKSLLPLQKLNEHWQQHNADFLLNQQAIEQLPVWFASHAQRLWQQRIDTISHKLNELQEIYRQLKEQHKIEDQQYKTLMNCYHQQGGGQLAHLEQQIDQQEKLLKTTQNNRQDYHKLLQRLSLPSVTSHNQFIEQQQLLNQQARQLSEQIETDTNTLHEIGAEKQAQKQLVDDIQDKLSLAKKQTSNIPPQFEYFRHQLAQHLQKEVEELPYVAQLVQVKADEQAWRGAIERALGSHRLRLIVPSSSMAAALAWVNQRDNRLHVRLYEANPTAHLATQTAGMTGFDDGFLHKLNYKDHPLTPALHTLLSGLDRHCVTDSHALRHRSHAMTKEGLMSGKSGWFDKQDQKRLTDEWYTGFDNKDLLKQLADELADQQCLLEQSKERYSIQHNKIKQSETSKNIIEQLCRLTFAQIDVQSVQDELNNLQSQLAILSAPDSDLAKLKLQYEQAENRLAHINDKIIENNVDIGTAKKQLDDAQSQQQMALVTLNTAKRDTADGQPLNSEITDHFTATINNDTVLTVINKAVAVPSMADIDKLSQLESSALKHFNEQKSHLQDIIKDIETKLVRQMEQAKRHDTGALSEVMTELRDLPDYLERLCYLTEEDLPSKQNQFLEYLNESSQAGINQLLMKIDDEVEKIRERITQINDIMKKVDFEQDKYLRLNATGVTHTSLRELEQARKRLREVSLTHFDSTDGEAHYAALQKLIAHLNNAVDKKQTLSAKALLDPRHRLSFSVSVLSRTDDRELESRTGSQGGSGGEKEIIASHILTASLSFALSPNGYLEPRFATIVLDEAFSKSSPKVATRIVNAIHAFGLHPLFVTPNKEMRLLREHTQSAVLVLKKGHESTLSNWSWQQIDDVAKQKLTT